MNPRYTQRTVNMEYLIGTLFGDPKYGTGDVPDDTSLASQYVRDLLRQQEGGVELVDLDRQAFNLGRAEGNVSPNRDCHYSEEGLTDAVNQIRFDADGNPKWYVEAVNVGYGAGSSGAPLASGAAFSTGYFYSVSYTHLTLPTILLV